MEIGQHREQAVHTVDFHVRAERVDVGQDVALRKLHDLRVFLAAACEQYNRGCF